MLIPLKLLQEHPLQQQLYDQLRALIVSARLEAGMRMPSSRVLADQFSISRMTVLLTYERLIAEGYLEAIPAVGTFVARPPTPPANGPAPPADVTGAVPYRARTLRATAADSQIGQPEIGQPDPSLFPIARWRALMRRTLERLGTHPDPSNAAGNAALRGGPSRDGCRAPAARPCDPNR
jgi:GntR family transcriptional regulator/MocR family aminotransferase